MIRNVLSRRQRPSWTSDRWHVVHARWNGESLDAATFERSIVSEHDDRDAARRAADELGASLSESMDLRPETARDQFFVRPPSFKSLKQARYMRVPDAT